MKHPERVLRKTTASVVRLHLLDCCLSRRMNAANLCRERIVPEHVGTHSGTPLPVFIPEDRELGLLRKLLGERLRVLRGKRIRQVIQRGSEVMQDVSDERSECLKRYGISNHTHREVIRQITVLLDRHSVVATVKPLPDLVLQVIQVVTRPNQFDLVSEDNCHEVASGYGAQAANAEAGRNLAPDAFISRRPQTTSYRHRNTVGISPVRERHFPECQGPSRHCDYSELSSLVSATPPTHTPNDHAQ